MSKLDRRGSGKVKQSDDCIEDSKLDANRLCTDYSIAANEARRISGEFLRAIVDVHSAAMGRGDTLSKRSAEPFVDRKSTC